MALWRCPDASVHEPASRSPRRALRVALASVLLLVGRMALPWHTSSETPPWGPFTHWLDLGLGPGTQDWAFVILGIGAVLAIALCVVIRSPGKGKVILLLVIGTLLLIDTLLEVFARPSVNPGPSLQADWGALVGTIGASVSWVAIATAMYLVQSEELLQEPTSTRQEPSSTRIEWCDDPRAL